MSFIMPESYHAREKQAMQDRIDFLTNQVNDQIRENEVLRRKLQKVDKAGRYYLRMQKHILEYEAIGDAWQEFLTLYILAIPDKRDLEELPDNPYIY